MINIIAEIGINAFYGTDRNEFMNNTKRLIDIAVVAGCKYVKFQKRTPHICVPEKQKHIMKTVPWETEPITYLDYKLHTEYSEHDYNEIDNYCESKGIEWFASIWDIPSAQFMSAFTNIVKIPSAHSTNLELLKACRELFDTVLVSTGMCCENEIEKLVENADPDIMFHTNSAYPTKTTECELNYITHLQNKFPDIEIGYSGHDTMIASSAVAVGLGCNWVERHLTENTTLWGSDQSASLDKIQFIRMCETVKHTEEMLGHSMYENGRILFESELVKKESLRQ